MACTNCSGRSPTPPANSGLLADDGRVSLRIEGSSGLSDSCLRLVNEESPLLPAPEGTLVGSPSRRAFIEGPP
ncbi:hypothetical protein E1265_17535 [Streptomyces sp. 8K308]|uniref:hypothetical protein n=1 Tax=Streptomyces sp. 8K308 TaxID=2530388 RepID=UPI00104EB5E4|nr:hypothetical protein [Streptomyces sp. 8K308]TDC21635.1 hypothetical protein E1265_17535 [Streptomyces sp. 8K308]